MNICINILVKFFIFDIIIIFKKLQILDEFQNQALISFLDFYFARKNFQCAGIEYKLVAFITLLSCFI